MAKGETIVTNAYTNTTQVIEIGGFKEQDDVTDGSINRAINAAVKYFERLAKTTFATPDDDMKLGIAHLACYLTAVELGKLGMDADTSYQRFLETANFLLGNVIGTNTLILNIQMGAMYLSTANTSPANPDADPYITTWQNW